MHGGGQDSRPSVLRDGRKRGSEPAPEPAVTGKSWTIAVKRKADAARGAAFLTQTSRERRAYPPAVCKKRTVQSASQGTAARKVALHLTCGIVARPSQPAGGNGASLRLAIGQKERNERHRIYGSEY